jgi:hypothetical protein
MNPYTLKPFLNRYHRQPNFLEYDPEAVRKGELGCRINIVVRRWVMACYVLFGGVAMGRSFKSVRMDVKEVSERWLKASRALKKEDQVYRQKLAEMSQAQSDTDTILLPQDHISDSIGVFLDIRGIELLEGDVWGHRKDLDEYFTVEDTPIKEIRILVASGMTMDEVAVQILQKAKVGPNPIKYS